MFEKGVWNPCCATSGKRVCNIMRVYEQQRRFCTVKLVLSAMLILTVCSRGFAARSVVLL